MKTKTQIPLVNFLVLVLDYRKEQALEKSSGLPLGKAAKLKKQLPVAYNELNEADQAAYNDLTVSDNPKVWRKHVSQHCLKHPEDKELLEQIDKEHFVFLPEHRRFAKPLPLAERHAIREQTKEKNQSDKKYDLTAISGRDRAIALENGHLCIVSAEDFKHYPNWYLQLRQMDE
jgi:hypothetical protein